MPDPPWLRLLKACIQNESASASHRFLQLATLSAQGNPSVRTVVFRGWHNLSKPGDPPQTALKIITDVRSEKMDGIAKHPWSEICWYFVQARVQFRLTGSITCVDAHEISPELKQARIDQWRGLSDAARVQFRYPPPGETRRVPADGSDPYLPEAPCRETPEPTFALLLLEPNTVDIVNLRENQRTLHRRLEGQCWEETAINP